MSAPVFPSLDDIYCTCSRDLTFSSTVLQINELILDSFFSEVFKAGKQSTPPIDWKFHAESEYAHIDPLFEILGSIFLRQSATCVKIPFLA